nr:hypothetical protein [Synarthrophyton patena]
MLHSRLLTYHKLITKYDSMDKEFLTSSYLVSDLDYIKITLHVTNFKDFVLFQLINKEFSTLQRTKLNSSPIKLDNFNVVLRKVTLYIYLEFLLYTNLKNINDIFKRNQKYCFLSLIQQRFNLFFHINFLFNLGYKVTIYNNKILLTLFLKNYNFSEKLNYYFIPINDN